MIPKYELQVLPPKLREALRLHLGVPADGETPDPRGAARFQESCSILTLCGGTELPSLQELVAGQFERRAPLVFSPVSREVWSWTRSLVASGDFLLVRLFRRRPTLLVRPLWPALASLCWADCREAWESGQLSTAAYRLAQFLGEHGPQTTWELQQSLPRWFPILPESVKKGLRELEEKLVIYVQRVGTRAGEKGGQTWELVSRGLAALAPQARQMSAGKNVGLLLEACVRAAGAVEAREGSQWFWNWKSETRVALQHLLSEGKVSTVGASYASILAWHELLAQPQRELHTEMANAVPT